MTQPSSQPPGGSGALVFCRPHGQANALAVPARGSCPPGWDEVTASGSLGGTGDPFQTASNFGQATGTNLASFAPNLDKLVNSLTSGAFWKSTGLVVIAILAGGLGAYLWLGSGQGERAQRSVEKAAVL